jgi:hypothetical protein
MIRARDFLGPQIPSHAAIRSTGAALAQNMATRAGLQWQHKRSFYPVMAALSAAIVFAGFARTFYLRSHFVHAPLAMLLLMHGAVFTPWLVLLLVQVSLVAAGRVDLHRRLGMAGAGLAAVMAVLGMATLLYAGRHGFSPPGGPPPMVFLVIPLFDILMFEGLFIAAFLHRRRPQTHKRLMVLATIAILPPAVARL